MTLDELIASIDAEEEKIVKAIIANDFSLDSGTEYDEKKVSLVEAYVDYLVAREEAKEVRIAFKYTDGEESVDKSGIYDQYRRYANDMLAHWRDMKNAYDKRNAGLTSFFTVRKRAGYLNERTR